MYRYYITRKNAEGIMDYPALPIPETVYHYGENGVEFDSIRGRIYGFVEHEKELPTQAVQDCELIPGPIPTYYSINEELARRAKEMMSFYEYKKGSKTAEYRRCVDDVYMTAHLHKQRVDPMYHEKIDYLANLYAKKLADNMNEASSIGTRCPSVMIAGPANFPVRKKEKQNAASDRNMEEWRHIQGLIEKIKGTGTGGISGDDPNALEKLREKRDRLVKHQELMKAANAAIRLKDTEEGDRRLAELGFDAREIAELRKPDWCGRVG